MRWVSDEPFPGWVEVHLDLADGTVAKLFGKPPVFTADDERLRAGASYPVDLELACDSWWLNRRPLTRVRMSSRS